MCEWELRKYQKIVIDWPYLCIGCGTDQNLTSYERVLVKVNWGLRGFYRGPLTKQSNLHLCMECTEFAQNEQKVIQNQARNGFILSSFTAFIGALLIGFFFGVLSITSVVLSMLIFYWFPKKGLKTFTTFRNRHQTESYYNVRIIERAFALGISFRNSEYTKGFLDNNSDIDPIVDNHSYFRIASKKVADYRSLSFSSMMIFMILAGMTVFDFYGGIFGVLSHLLWYVIILFVYAFHQRRNSSYIVPLYVSSHT